MKTVKLFCCASIACVFLWASTAIAQRTSHLPSAETVPPLPVAPFSPSQVRTEDGNLIPVEAFFSATRCAGCHTDTHAGWSESLHRNAAREPFYRESADILLRTRGIEFTRHCESCHTPVALLSGTLTSASGKTAAPFTPLDAEGVTCVICHSITEARLDGTGSFTIRRPALLAHEDGTPIFGNFSDEQILADIPGHKRAMMRPLLRQPEFCATCHKVTAPPDLNGYKQIPGFSAYDEWQQSGASHEVLSPFYRRESRLDCRSCHMPKVASSNDRAAKNGLITLHRWPGANTAVPMFYGQTEQVRLTEQFLAGNHLKVDVFSLQRESTGEVLSPLESETALKKPASGSGSGETFILQAVIANRNVAHSFPPEVRDLYEAWVECEVTDETGQTLFHSGFIKPDGMLDERAHVYKTILLDSHSRTITRHQIWLIQAKGYDHAIPAGRSDVVRFRMELPEGVGNKLTVRVKVNYRRLNQEYTTYVLNRQHQSLTLPVITMAEDVKVLTMASDTPTESNPLKIKEPSGEFRATTARRWNDFGIGLLEQAEYGAAAMAFEQATRLQPTDPQYFVNAAIAEFRTERFAPERLQQQKAATWLEQAARLDSTNPRMRYYRALVRRAEGKWVEAADELTILTGLFPRDRELHRQLAQTRLMLGQFVEAEAAARHILAIDPNDAGAYQFLAAVYTRTGRSQEAEWAAKQYVLWREDPLANEVAARFYTAHPEWQELRTKRMIYGKGAPLRPVLTGSQASPVE